MRNAREMRCACDAALHSVLRQFVLEPSPRECWGNGRGLGGSVCVRVRGVRALSGGSGCDGERRCELHELVRDRFDFGLVMLIFVDKDLEGG